jgi:hypothetical protein
VCEASKRNLDAALAFRKRINPPQDIESKKITGVRKIPQVCRFLVRQDKGENGKELKQAGIIAQAFTEGTGMGQPASKNVREGE